MQKHLASHLYYDLRLEHDDVLLPWAVPKVPSLDPRRRRLAMHVEDHPIDYRDFDGVIPSGYGAGIVMLWDRGTWTPEVDDVDAALKQGDLKLTLNGYKLKGSCALVRTKGGPRSNHGRTHAGSGPARYGGSPPAASLRLHAVLRVQPAAWCVRMLSLPRGEHGSADLRSGRGRSGEPNHVTRDSAA